MTSPWAETRTRATTKNPLAVKVSPPSPTNRAVRRNGTRRSRRRAEAHASICQNTAESGEAPGDPRPTGRMAARPRMRVAVHHRRATRTGENEIMQKPDRLSQDMRGYDLQPEAWPHGLRNKNDRTWGGFDHRRSCRAPEVFEFS